MIEGVPRETTLFQIWALLPYNSADNTPRRAPEYSAKIALKNMDITRQKKMIQGL